MRNDGIFSIVKGVGVALAISLLCAVIFANVLRTVPLSTRTVYFVNQSVKCAAVLVGALLFVRGEGGWRKGGGIGVLFSLLSYLLFSAVGGDFSLSWLAFAELFFIALLGAVGGIIAVNLRR